MMASLSRDAAYAFRTARKRWGNSLVLFASLAVGIFLSSLAFSVVDSVLLRPLANYREPDRLVLLWGVWSAGDTGLFSSADFFDYQERVGSFESLAAFNWSSFTVGGGNQPGYLSGLRVSPGYFAAAGLQPSLGRVFSPGEQEAVLLSDQAWERQFERDPEVLTRRLELDGRPHAVVGVLPPHVSFPSSSIQIWVPLMIDPQERKLRNARNLAVLGRLKPGVGLAGAEEDLKRVAAWLEKTYPRTNEGYSVRLVRLRDQLVGDYETTLLLTQGATLVILLLSCVNVVKMLIARSRVRSREMAVRCALGAGRLRILGNSFLEVAVLALPAALLAVAAVRLAVSVLVPLSPIELPRQSEIGTHWPVALFGVCLALLFSMLAALAPAWSIWRTDPAQSLTGSAGSGRSRLSDILVQLEVAVAVVLLAGAALLLQSFYRIQAIPLGYNPAGVVAVRLAPEGARYAEIESQRAFWLRIIREAGRLPAVSAAAASTDLPMLGEGILQPVALDGAPLADPANPKVRVVTVSSEFFRLMGISVLKGRPFGAEDRLESPGAALVNQAFARRFWPGRDPLGRKLETISRPLSVVGVVEDNLLASLFNEPQPALYMSSRQNTRRVAEFLLLRTHDADRALKEFRALMHSLDPGQPVGASLSLQDWVFRETAQSRFVMQVLSAFAVASIVLAQIGIAGMAASWVAQRQREMGIRMALGAAPSSAVALLVKRSALRVAAGLATGIAAALGLTRFLSHLLYSVQPDDFNTLAASFLVLFLTGLLASYLPARGAAKINLSRLLRTE